ncbi:UDP-N-acetylmuramate dehydrogenase [Gorillibacterium timonense]|uniref:UDP-N-acetylmuramate dehydrogenase n=1 Tax=Gorillibacterium timonense TaxID=1689269 RepID=UPI00071C9D2C|nr:UDP-N-acetylmuramate dehydrogenase [Gorillibacterium timonense]
MQQLIADLQTADAGVILTNEPLSAHTTWKIGGPADLLATVHNRDQLVRLMQLLHAHGTPWHVLGRGSNVLVSDKGVRGAVIKLAGELADARFEDGLIRAGGGYSFIKLSVLAGKQGLTGLEFAGGIPGSVGGAVYMNAGAHGSDVSRILKEAEVVLEDGEVEVWTREDLLFRYRHSVLQERAGIVTEAVFALEPGDRKEIAGAMATYKDRRLRTQPLQLPCAGSTFRNPEGHHAAKLIEAAGLKGQRVGGAEVSTLHANFIINTGTATAQDVLDLIDLIRTRIVAQFGVVLTPEVLIMGEMD